MPPPQGNDVIPGRLPEPINGPQGEALRRQLADNEITAKWNSLGGLPGEIKIPGDAGLIQNGRGFHRDYKLGRLYNRPGSGVFYIANDIEEKYNALDTTRSWLGWPIRDEENFTEGGRATAFENGAIYYWPETGPIDLKNVSVRYTGLVCFGETDNDQLSSSDEPYVILGSVPAPPAESSTQRTRVYEGVDHGESRGDNIEVFRGLPNGMALTVVLMEHDLDNPDRYRDTVKIAVQQASAGVSVGVGFIPVVGPFLAPVAAAFLKEVGPDIEEAVNGILNLNDDKIDVTTLQITAKDMVTMTRQALMEEKGIRHHIASPLLTGEGASYKIYLDITAV